MSESAQRKKLTEEELRASADRLSHPPKRNTELPPLVEKKVVTKEALNKSIEHLYTQSLTQRKTMLEQLDKKAHPDMVKHVSLDQDVLQQAFCRLHDESMRRKKENLKKLGTKYDGGAAQRVGKKLSADEIKASGDRIYRDSLEKTRETHQKLFEKYVLATEPKCRKLTKEELKASAQRLSSRAAS